LFDYRLNEYEKEFKRGCTSSNCRSGG
jgi:hypothetical protein